MVQLIAYVSSTCPSHIAALSQQLALVSHLSAMNDHATLTVCACDDWDGLVLYKPYELYGQQQPLVLLVQHTLSVGAYVVGQVGTAPQ